MRQRQTAAAAGIGTISCPHSGRRAGPGLPEPSPVRPSSESKVKEELKPVGAAGSRRAIPSEPRSRKSRAAIPVWPCNRRATRSSRRRSSCPVSDTPSPTARAPSRAIRHDSAGPTMPACVASGRIVSTQTPRAGPALVTQKPRTPTWRSASLLEHDRRRLECALRGLGVARRLLAGLGRAGDGARRISVDLPASRRQRGDQEREERKPHAL